MGGIATAFGLENLESSMRMRHSKYVSQLVIRGKRQTDNTSGQGSATGNALQHAIFYTSKYALAQI